jgi:GMP synthase (glutamine-hydrolysing)
VTNLNLLIVEGNVKKDSEIFTKAAGASVSENLKSLILKLEPTAMIKIVHPGNDLEVKSALDKINIFDGIIFTGGAMRIKDQTEEIKKHIHLAKECFKHNKKILAICWGLQICVTAAGGNVSTGKNGAHLGIASNVEINDIGKKHPIYKDKNNFFNTPAFNFDEVNKVPSNAIILSSDKINNVMGLFFYVKSSEIWGLQYHPDYYYKQTINLANLRKQKLLDNNYFNNNNDFENHIMQIEIDEKKLSLKDRAREIINWLNFIKV